VITHDKTIFAELQIIKMGHIAFTIRDAIHATKSDQRPSCGRFPGRSSSSRTLKFYDDLPDEIVEVNLINTSSEEQVWQLFFNGVSRISPEGNIVAGVGVVLISSHNYVISHAFLLTELCSNNVSKYNALLIGMQLAEEIGVKNFEAYGDSKLIINQVREEYEV